MSSIPKLCHHKKTGRAYVTLNGVQHYVGKWGTKAASREYDELIKRWLANDRELVEPDADPTINELIVAYVKHCNTYYGKKSDELADVKNCLRIVQELYGSLPASQFGPLKLDIVRSGMIERDWCRRYINEQVGRVKRMFRWCVSQEMVPGAVFENLKSLEALKRGRTEARESEPIKPIDHATINKTLKKLQDIPAAMVRIQLLTGCRPNEICQMKPASIDRSQDVWIFKPEKHKTEHFGKIRAIAIGPEAQAILAPYLLRDTNSYCFSPAEAMEQRRREARLKRKKPLKYEKRKPKKNPKRKPGDLYTTDSYRRAIHRACDDAKIPRWSPNRLRHTAATEIRKRFGLEAAQVMLGHSSPDITQVYAEVNQKRAIEIAKQIG